MATKSFDRTIVIKSASAIKMIKEEMQKSDYTYFPTGKKVEEMSKEKVKSLAAKILKDF